MKITDKKFGAEEKLDKTDFVGRHIKNSINLSNTPSFVPFDRKADVFKSIPEGNICDLFNCEGNCELFDCTQDNGPNSVGCFNFIVNPCDCHMSCEEVGCDRDRACDSDGTCDRDGRCDIV